jgi:uncharacterized protein (TIGR02328 family)
MRLWHKDLIPYLPKQQLVAQWRELNSIYVNQNKHILIDYVYGYSTDDLYIYSLYVIREMRKRDYKIKLENFCKYFNESDNDKINETIYSITGSLEFLNKYIEMSETPFIVHHDKEYLKICCWNLWEKYIRGQKGFTPEAVHFINIHISKRIIQSNFDYTCVKQVAGLKKQLDIIKIKLKCWRNLLDQDGINSKKIVREEITKVLEELKND